MFNHPIKTIWNSNKFLFFFISGCVYQAEYVFPLRSTEPPDNRQKNWQIFFLRHFLFLDFHQTITCTHTVFKLNHYLFVELLNNFFWIFLDLFILNFFFKMFMIFMPLPKSSSQCVWYVEFTIWKLGILIGAKRQNDSILDRIELA